jgi:hypothetical protein
MAGTLFPDPGCGDPQVRTGVPGVQGARCTTELSVIIGDIFDLLLVYIQGLGFLLENPNLLM